MRSPLPRYAPVATFVVAMAVGVALLTRRSSESRVDLPETNVRTPSFRSVRASHATGPQDAARDSFTRELETVNTEHDVITRDEHLDRLLAEIDSSSASNLLERLQSEPPTRTTLAAELRLIRKWAESDPMAAANWLIRTAPETRMDAISQV